MGRLQRETHPIQYSAARQLESCCPQWVLPHRVPASRRACRRSSVVGITETHKGQLRPPGPPHGIGSETSICRAGQSLPPRAAGRRRTPTHSDSGSTSPHSRVYWEATGVSLSTGPKCCPTGHGGPPGPRIANGSPGAPSRETHRSERGRQAGQRSQQRGTGGGDRLALPYPHFCGGDKAWRVRRPAAPAPPTPSALYRVKVSGKQAAEPAPPVLSGALPLAAVFRKGKRKESIQLQEGIYFAPAAVAVAQNPCTSLGCPHRAIRWTRFRAILEFHGREPSAGHPRAGKTKTHDTIWRLQAFKP